MAKKQRTTDNRQRTTSIITLLTDFGVQDEYVGVMKGVILSINSSVRLVDITHTVRRHSIEQASLILKATFSYFPEGAIHVVVVDPGVGGDRRIVCLKQDGHIFLAPDNGVLTMVVDEERVEKVYSVTNPRYFLKPVSETFHGRDIFAPVAAHLSKGSDLRLLGKEIAARELKRFDVVQPSVSEGGELIGRVVAIDQFGNLITNIDRTCLEVFRQDTRPEDLVIGLGKSKIEGVAKSYDSVQIGEPLAIFGSRNLLEVSVNCGDAGSRFKFRVGQAVRVSRSKRKIP